MHPTHRSAPLFITAPPSKRLTSHHDALNATTAALSAVSSPPHPDYSARPWPQVVFTIMRSIPTLPKEVRQHATQMARHILNQSDLLLPRALAAVSPIRRVALGECIGWMMRLRPAKDPESILTPSPSPWLQDAVASMVIPILVTPTPGKVEDDGLVSRGPSISPPPPGRTMEYDERLSGTWRGSSS